MVRIMYRQKIFHIILISIFLCVTQVHFALVNCAEHSKEKKSCSTHIDTKHASKSCCTIKKSHDCGICHCSNIDYSKKNTINSYTNYLLSFPTWNIVNLNNKLTTESSFTLSTHHSILNKIPIYIAQLKLIC